MKNHNSKYILLIAILIFIYSNGFTQRDTIYLNKGDLYSVGRISNHHYKTGIWKTYNLKGILVEKGKYKLSHKHGKFKKYENNIRNCFEF